MEEGSRRRVSFNSSDEDPASIDRWRSAIRKVIREPRRSPRLTNEDRDLVGEHVVKIIRNHTSFQITSSEDESEGYSPLLSSKNIQRLRRIACNPWQSAVLILSLLKSWAWSLVKDRRPMLHGLIILGWMSLLTSFIMALCCQALLLSMGSTVYLICYFSFTLLVDVQDLKALCPRPILSIFHSLSSILRWMDGVLLGGYLYSWREWNDDSYVKSGPSRSQKTTLLKCPPPSTVHGRRKSLDWKHVRQPRWGLNTTRHAIAMNFCYTMLNDEEKLANKRKSLHRAASGPVCSSRRALSQTSETKSDLSLHDPGKEETDRDLFEILATDDDTVLEGSDQPIHERHLSDESILLRRSFSVGTLGDSDDEHSLLSEERRPNRPASMTQRGVSDCTDISADDDDMNWAEVGARIGIRILRSEHVQRAVASQETAERIMDISKKVEQKFAAPDHSSLSIGMDDSTSDVNTYYSDARSVATPLKPVHSMWTSPAMVREPASPMSDTGDSFVESPLAVRRMLPGFERRPPLKRLGSTTSTGKSVSFGPWEASSISSTIGVVPSQRGREEAAVVIPFRDRESSTEVILLNGMHRSENGSFVDSVVSGVSSSDVSDMALSMKQPPKRPLLRPGVKMVVPIFPLQPGIKRPVGTRFSRQTFQMATVVSSSRIHIRTRAYETPEERRQTNCLCVKVNLDKSFLRDGDFATMTFRVMDLWNDRYVPRHSKFPIGSCVATTFGVGVLVGWRVEDDCHIVRSLWQRTRHRGSGSANAYLNREALHGIVEAAVGFPVDTRLGKGVVISYVSAGREFKNGRYYVLINQPGKFKGHVLECNRCDILACMGPEFVPVIELIREAAEYQIQVDNYKSAVRRQIYGEKALEEKKWRNFSKGFETIWSAFLKAVEEDEGFDHGVSEFFSSIIKILEQFENTPQLESEDDQSKVIESDSGSVEDPADGNIDSAHVSEKPNSFSWFVDDLFGGVFGRKNDSSAEALKATQPPKYQWSQAQYDQAFAVIRALMKTVTIARAECKDQPNLKLALSIVYEFLLFVRTVIKIQQKNLSAASLAVWERAIEEIISTFGPVKTRIEKIGRGIASRIEKHGRKAKIRVIRFVDIIVSDERLILALERGEWDTFLARVEDAFVQARIIDEQSRENYHRTIEFVLSHFTPNAHGAAARRNNVIIAHFAKAMKWLSSPKRSLLKYIRGNTILDMVQRILVRVFRNDPVASRMITIHASNMTTLRQLRMLKDLTISGKLWIPLLDAADQEFSWAVSKMSAKSKDIVVPLSKLVSLGVAQFHKIYGGDLTADWMDFLLQDEAVQLIHEIDMKLILLLEKVSKDIKQVMVVLPYYPSLDDDILNLLDEVDIDEFLKEASDAIVDEDLLAAFIREKSTIAVQRFLDYLPKMAIPVQQRDLGDNWVLTCRSESGGDLTLSDVHIKRENLTCQVLGGEPMFFPMFAGASLTTCDSMDEGDVAPSVWETGNAFTSSDCVESSILDQIRELLLNAQRHGCWQPGIGGVGQQASDRYVASVLAGVPVSSVLNTGIELWRSLEIDDDELMEIAIRDVSFQIQLQNEREEGLVGKEISLNDSIVHPSKYMDGVAVPEPAPRHRFNPRVDPTLLYLEMKKLTVHLNKFRFRIEKKQKTIFDPVFEGWGTLRIQNVSIKIRVECRKERISKLDAEMPVPVLHCRELEVKLEKVKFKVNDTGADWILNKVVKQFSSNITEVVETNLKEEVRKQVDKALENLNSYFVVNPDLMLSILGVTMDDLEDNIVWV